MKTLLALGATLTLSSAALANGQGEVDLDDLRGKCEQILANPQMVKPQVTITCDKHRYVWKECPSSFPLDDTATVGAKIGMKDWLVQQTANHKDTKNKVCAVYTRHHLYVRPVQEIMDCKDLLAHFRTQQDLNAHCDAVLRDRVQQDPGLVRDDGPTGDVINTCNGTTGSVQQGVDPCRNPGGQNGGQNAGQQGQNDDASQNGGW